jgi:5-oxoprolinase (ATP-hydrolysing)
MSLSEIAEGFLRIAVDNMANAIRKISIARGHDVTRYTLVSFGGAGGQHACRVADSLGIERILVHPLASLLSAYGIGLADVKAVREAGMVQPLAEDFMEALRSLEAEATEALVRQGIQRNRIELRRRSRLRLTGSDTTLEIGIAPKDEMRADFTELHRRRFGYVDETGEIILDALIVEAVAHTGTEAIFSQSLGAGAQPRTVGGWQVYDRDNLSVHQQVSGPALVTDRSSVTVIEPGWSATRSNDGTLVLTRAVPAQRSHAIGTSADPVMLEIFNNLFMAIAEEMGVALQSTIYGRKHSDNYRDARQQS